MLRKSANIALKTLYPIFALLALISFVLTLFIGNTSLSRVFAVFTLAALLAAIGVRILIIVAVFKGNVRKPNQTGND